ncbi:MAG: hypothetical protein NTW03_05505, partial [Verrucomicrobia bacterium]|nr:hypothetical protein [Verrucomicrobiota bacterium]
GGFTTFNGEPRNGLARVMGGGTLRAGNLAFSAAAYTVFDAAGYATITVLRLDGASGSVTVDYATHDQSAVVGRDYANSAGTLTFLNNEMIKTFTVPIINSAQVEPNETLALSLSNAGGGAGLASPSNATVTIVSSKSVVSLIATNYAVPENVAASNAIITVVRAGYTNSVVSVDCRTLPGTATPYVRYVPVTNTLVFGVGEVSKSFLVPIINNTVADGNQTFYAQLSNVTNRSAYLDTNSSLATVTIIDDDVTPGMITFSQPAYSVTQGSNAVITVLRTNGAAGVVTVQYQTLAGTAQPGENPYHGSVQADRRSGLRRPNQCARDHH